MFVSFRSGLPGGAANSSSRYPLPVTAEETGALAATVSRLAGEAPCVRLPRVVAHAEGSQ